MNPIYHISPFYWLVSKYTRFMLRRFYSEVVVVGREHLPDDDSALIFAPNHLNAMMDALILLLLAPRRKTVVFLAKADLFHSKFTAALMRFAKILPAYRMGDGIENLAKNNDVFEQCIQVMAHGQYIGIMPEGGQGEQHRVRPLVKGVFRIAFEAQQRFGSAVSVKIVPVGIDMGDLIKAGKPLIINIGKPIDIQKYMGVYAENPSTTTNAVKSELRRSLSRLTRDIASAQNYDIIKFVSDVEGYKFMPDKNDKAPFLSRFRHKQRKINELVALEKENPAEFERVKEKADKLREELTRLALSPAVFSTEKISVLRLLIGFPAFLFGFLTNVLPMFLPVWIRRALRVEYDGYYSSIHFALGLITFPLFYVLQTVLFANVFHVGYWGGAVFFLLQYLSRPYALKWWRETRIYRKRAFWEK